ncbi:hypothetical protein OOJ91_12510 [Micromonospora lupini]|uniref:hypothetical protein n=1 Tax=Micromonospora lupini TaxID=285679 RepID=UPI002256C5D5|nr:hypothetical protein [Micromonospora lupini]MCX5066702.1 hypothetical protein [Micromonospora lupini]
MAIPAHTVTGPNDHGRYFITTGRYRIQFGPRSEYERLHPAVIVSRAVCEAADPELARLAAEEKQLPAGRRYAERGTIPDVDELYDRLNARTDVVSVAVARELLPLLEGYVDGDLNAAIGGAFFNQHAMCETCTCSPGVSLPTNLTIAGNTVDVWVDPIEQAGE